MEILECHIQNIKIVNIVCYNEIVHIVEVLGLNKNWIRVEKRKHTRTNDTYDQPNPIPCTAWGHTIYSDTIHITWMILPFVFLYTPNKFYYGQEKNGPNVNNPETQEHKA